MFLVDEVADKIRSRILRQEYQNNIYLSGPIVVQKCENKWQTSLTDDVINGNIWS